MGEVIPLFRAVPVPRPDGREPFEPYVVLTEEIQAEIVEVTADIETLWTAGSPEEFVATMRSIKDRVARWPDGG